MPKLDPKKLDEVMRDAEVDDSVADRLRQANQDPPAASRGGGASSAPAGVNADF